MPFRRYASNHNARIDHIEGGLENVDDRLTVRENNGMSGWTTADRGFLAESYPASISGGSTTMTTAGRIEFTKIKLPVAATVTNITMWLVTDGATLTSGQCFVALYTEARALVSQGAASQHTAWSTGAAKVVTMALATPTLCAAGNYYVAFWFNGTTGPTWARGTAVNAGLTNMGTSGNTLMVGNADTSITTTAPATMGSQTAATNPWWAALS